MAAATTSEGAPARWRRQADVGAAAGAARGRRRLHTLGSNMLILVLVLLLVYPVECVRVRGARGEEKAATAEELPPEGGDSPPAAPPLRARNKTTVTVAVAPHKVGRLSVPNAEKGMTLSRIAYGSLHFPEFEDDVERLYENLLTCIKLGITTIDLSDVYGWYKDGHGKSNDIFAKVLKAHPELRPRLELVAKFGIRLSGGYHTDLSKEWIEESMDRYLELFHTKYLDVFMIHNPDPNMDPEEIAKAFKSIKDAKKARAFGISNFHQWEYEALRDAMAEQGLKLSVHEMETSVLHPDKIADGTVDYYSKGENELALLGWGPLGGDPNGGKNLLFGSEGEREKRIVQALADKGEQLAMALDNSQGKKEVRGLRPDEVAVAWLLHHPANIVPIIGTTLVNRILDQSRPPEMVTMGEQDWDDVMAALHY